MLIPYSLRIVCFFALFGVVGLDVIAFTVALLLAIWPPFRRMARQLAGGVIASLPFLLFFQGLSLPVLGALAAVPLLLGLWPPAAVHRDLISTTVDTLILAEFAIASAVGLATGWGVGARATSNMTVREALSASRPLSSITAGLNRLLPGHRPASPERGLAIGVAVILLAAGALVLARTSYVEAKGSNEMDYRGEKVRLANKYLDYDDYLHDPVNLAAGEIPRVEKMMTDAVIGPDLANWHEASEQLNKLRFPGYAMGSGPQIEGGGGREFVIKSVEIPQVAKDRYVVLEKRPGGAFHVADDFVTPHDPRSAYDAIAFIRLVDGKLVYGDRSGKIVRETPIRP